MMFASSWNRTVHIVHAFMDDANGGAREESLIRSLCNDFCLLKNRYTKFLNHYENFGSFSSEVLLQKMALQK